MEYPRYSVQRYLHEKSDRELFTMYNYYCTLNLKEDHSLECQLVRDELASRGIFVAPEQPTEA